MKKHLVLLGDSIFDNAAYVGGGPSVIDQVSRLIPLDWSASLLAVDGHTTAEVAQQMGRLADGATHLVLSVGGNDALGSVPELEAPASSILHALSTLTAMKSVFGANYRQLVTSLLGLRKPLLLCTIYDSVPGLPDELKTALGLFNEVILRVAIECQLPVLDLRLICTEAGDYSVKSPIEPSSQGGEKIARKMVETVANHDFAAGGCRVYQ
jgi:lysophospholipase L1-like esterase